MQAPRLLEARIGDQVSATGLLIAPGESDTFSYADYLARAGVFSIMRDASVEVLGHSPSLLGSLSDLKARAAQFIVQALPEPQASLLTGILLGNARGIAPAVEEAFQRVGVAHVIAISGFNMAILSGVVMGFLETLRLPTRRAALIGIGVIALYSLFVGANPSVLRAAIMSSLLVIGTAMRRKTYVPASLALAAVLMSALNPTLLWDIGFQLSFFATLGLALFADPLSLLSDRLLARLAPASLAQPLGSLLVEPAAVTLAAQITTLPLTMVYFSRLSLVSLLANLLVLPVQAWLLVLGILAVLLAFVLPAVAQVLFWFDLVLLSWTIGVVRLFARLPFADVELHIDPRLVAAFFIVLLGAAMLHATQPAWALRLARAIRQRSVTSAALFAGASTLLLSAAVLFSRPDHMLHLWLLDLGHSNAVLMQSPGGAQILVDGGRFPSRLLTALGDRMPFYDREIEVLMLTQPDENDTGALSAVLNRYDVGLVLSNGQPNLSPAFSDLETQWAGLPQVKARAGYHLDMNDGLTLEVLHPTDEPGLDDSLNAKPLVTRLRYGAVSFLLTGDLSVAGQQSLLENGQWPQATVLQLPQHGGAETLDAAFLRAVQPQLALVEADPANRLGDPDPDTLAMLDDTPVYRTDKSGTLHLWTDGVQLWLQAEH